MGARVAGKIFVNYRRDDAKAEAARLHDRLALSFGAANVFMDVDNLLAGERFDLRLREALQETDVFLAVIGARWFALLETRAESGERDYVREEIAAALARKIVVIPVLMDRAPLPKPASLPEDIRELALYHKHDVVYESFGRDVAALVAAIETHRQTRDEKAAEAARLAQKRKSAEPAQSAIEKARVEGGGGRIAGILKVLGSLVAIGFLLAAIYSYRTWGGKAEGPATQESQSGPVQTEPPSAAVVRVKRNSDGRFAITARINGIDVPVIVDTGASTVVLNSDDARKAGIQTDSLSYATPVETGNGSFFAARVTLDKVSLGELTVAKVDALVMTPGTRVKSLLGMSFLSRLRSYEFSGNQLLMRG
jgi:aspartyl protease family protein